MGKLRKLLGENREKIKSLCLNIGGIALLNIVIQFLVYPLMERQMGHEDFGVALSLLALVSITSNTVGIAVNYARLVKEREMESINGDYNLFLLFGGLISAGIGIFYLWYLELISVWSVLLYTLLIIATAFRFYSDVEFKIKGNSLRYFLFYATVSVGYIAGLLIYRLTGNWMSAILTGELSGIAFALFASGIYRHVFRPSRRIGTVWKSIILLLLAGLLENLTLNADRLILLVFSGGEAVTVYYIASLLGKVAALLSTPMNAVIISYLIRYDKDLTPKFWSAFVVGGLVVSALGVGACFLGSYILLPILYADAFALAKGYILPAITGQLFFFISGVLLVVLLRFRGEKMQFVMNLVYAVEFFALVLIGTWRFGLDGFVWATLIANVLRFVIITVWGFWPRRPKKQHPQGKQQPA